GFVDPAKAPAWRVQADPLDASAAGRARAGDFAVAAAVRKSWLDRVIDAVGDPQQLAPNAPVPRWTDGQLVGRGKLREDVTLSGWVIGALDRLARTLPSDDPATQTEQRIAHGWVRAQVTVRRDRPGAWDTATLWFGRDTSRDELQVGLVPAHLHVAQWVGGARASQQSKLTEIATLTIGA